ncbi:plastocyanin/azurin family copper-binding protein [Halorussus salilacus]|uniref:plastocyanin/azurin family copper-binding protein n=1 Tax=Halorussus salilacus TaxID=2953750 RepID=UPI00209DAD72|nr:plastocyanin/azurin family copper-binding protein [Halorussus salilacus]USZ68672.1 plastocyanin/azurin family copper-binding protein [Halorussus salilacus]
MTNTEPSESVTRRGFMRTATGAAATAAAAGTAAGQDNESEGDGDGGGGGSTEEVTVGPGGELVYDPAELEITPGTTVKWVWDSDNHNVVAESTPDDSDWEGTEGGDDETYDTGYEYEYTFETEGDYAYYCTPHQSAGMEATITVSEDAGGGGAAAGPAVPSSAKTLSIATTAALVFTLGLAYFFIKFGGDYGELDE